MQIREDFSAPLRLVERFLLPVALTVFAAPFLVLLFYAVPATDDFCKATLSFNGVPQKSVMAITWLYFTQWSPRWLTTLTQSFIMSRVNLVASYGWLLLAILVGNLAALWYFFRICFLLERRTALLAAGVFFGAWLATLPSPEEEVYWLTGSTEYYLSLATLILLVSLLVRPRSSAWYYGLVVVLSIAIPAQHEIAGAFLVAVLVTATVVSRIKHFPVRQWIVSVVLAGLSFAVVLLSPGNGARAAQEHRHLWDLRHLPYWFGHAFYHGLDWLSYSPLLLAACCIALLYQGDRKSHPSGENLPRWIGVAAAGGMVAILGEYGLVQMASGSWSPSRVVAWFEFFFWLLFVCAILTGLNEVSKISVSSGAKAIVFSLLAVALITSPNFRSALDDLRGSAQSWWRADSSQLRRQGGDVRFEVPDPYPNLAMHQEVQPDSGCWVNRCLANYLRADTVVADSSEEECPH